MSDVIKALSLLFKGNDRSYGVWIPDSMKMLTESGPAGIPQYERHIQGVRGLGIVPVTDSGDCWFGAIDIDNHGQTEDINLVAMTKLIRDKNLPLVACRSKSGGIHVYVFCKSPIKSKLLRIAMFGWAAQLGFPKAEIYPKQDYLEIDETNVQQLGNWINLAYFGGDSTNRYCLNDNYERSTLKEFIDQANSVRISISDLELHNPPDNAGAPPCVQKMLACGVSSGGRNEALYNITVYYKRANPDTYIDDALDTNVKSFNPPLPTAEARRTIKSASRRDYKYRCQQEPIKSLCDSKACIKREFGITRSEFDELNANEMLPEFGGVIKYLTDPVRWGITVNGMLINNLPTETLYNFEALKNRITEVLTLGVPSVTKRNWEKIIIPLIGGAREIRLPDDASISGLTANRLREFIDKANFNVQDDIKEREKLLRGAPCIVEILGEKVIAFRAMDFVKYLKSVKSEEVKGPNLWFILNNIPDLPLEHIKISVKGKKITVWYTRLAGYSKAEYPAPEIKQEF